MRARIYRPSRSATQSGQAGSDHWVLEFERDSASDVDPLMGWTGSDDMNSQVRLDFPTREAAEAYAAERGLEAVLVSPRTRRPNIRARGYGENFVPNRRGAWTH